MATMSRYPDNYFDLAVVDPPYGIGEDGGSQRTRGSKNKNGAKKGWDKSPPNIQYFKALFRVSKNQIIWGANHFADRVNVSSPGWIIWDKMDYGSDFSDFEMAFTSFKRAAKSYRQTRQSNQGRPGNPRIHPTQKPAALYQWIYKNYAKPGDKILDTHYGSGSNGIALNKMNGLEQMNLTMVAAELDKDYYDAAKRRFDKATLQMSIF